MKSLLIILLILHIVCGFAALLVGFLSMLNRKGGKSHQLTGKIFFVGMTGVFITSTGISILKNIPFLLMVGFFSYHMACSGYRILYLKKLYKQQKPKLLDWIIHSIGLLAGIGLIVFSVFWFKERGIWGIVPLAFGTLTCINSIVDLRAFIYRPGSKQFWITRHGARMGGAFAATVTAFIVVNFSIGAYTWLLWILPGLITGVWISKTLKKFITVKHLNQISLASPVNQVSK